MITRFTEVQSVYIELTTYRVGLYLIKGENVNYLNLLKFTHIPPPPKKKRRSVPTDLILTFQNK